MDELFWNENMSIGEVERLLREFKRNEDLVKNIGANFYQIVYPVQLRRHEKMGISTREVGSTKVRLKRNSSTYFQRGEGRHEYDRTSNTFGRNRSKMKKHYHRTSLLIKAFNHKFRLDLELNTQLLSQNLVQRHFFSNGAEQFSKQDIEHCYYHGTVKDYPGATAAFHTCNGVSGVIQVGNETFVIHPFYGGDMSQKHPHVIFEARTKINKGCANSGNMEWRPQKNNRRPKRISDNTEELFDHFSDSSRSLRDVRDVTKFVETALIIDKAMFEKRNGSSKAEVIHDAIQAANIADLYFKSLNTRISIVYIESWQGNNQITIDRNQDISRTLLNFNDYTSRKLFKIEKDTTQLLTGEAFEGAEAGMSVQNTVCTAKSVGVSVDVNSYELHLLAGSLAHMIGHNIGMSHDDGREECFCRDWHGCIMAQSIVGLENVQPYKFSECSRTDYIDSLRVGHGICLLNKPSELEIRRSCGNGIVEDDEDCDCGSVDDCQRTNACCDPLTCKFTKESECDNGPCCHKCKLKKKGELCRQATNECDLPEYCDGENGNCPINLYKKNGWPCNSRTGYCYNGICPTLNLQCSKIWGDGGIAADEKCFEQFNSKGSINGHCGSSSANQYIKCAPENVRCGTLQCQLGNRVPVIKDLDQMFSRTIISLQGFEYECKSLGGAIDQRRLMDMILVKDGTSCGENFICINQTCVNIFSHIKITTCPSSSKNLECSGHGACTNVNKCFCEPGWSSSDCSIRTEMPYKFQTTTSSTVDPILNKVMTSSSSETSNTANFTLVMQKKETPYESYRGSNTVFLVIVLMSVVGGVFVIFAMMALCYRKRGTDPNKYDTSVYDDDEDGNQVSMKNSTANSNDGSVDSSNKVLSSSNIPSYSHTDSQRVLFRPNHIPNNNSLNYKYYSDQNMHKLNRFGVMRNDEDGEILQSGEEEIVSFIDLPHGKLNEKKGILKKQGSAYGLMISDLLNEDELLHHANSLNITNPVNNNPTMSQVEKTLKSLNGYHDDIIEALKSATSNRESTLTPSMLHDGLSAEETLRKSLPDFHLSDYLKRSSRCTSQDKMCELPQTHGLLSEATTHLSRLSSPNRCLNHSNDENESSGPLRIRNLEDLIRQLEHHSRHMSPINTEELRISDADADQNFRLELSSACSDSSQQSQRFCGRDDEDQRYVYSRNRQLNNRNSFYRNSRRNIYDENIYQNDDSEDHRNDSESSTTISPLAE